MKLKIEESISTKKGIAKLNEYSSKHSKVNEAVSVDIDAIKNKYPKGTSIKIIEMDGEPRYSGTVGKVEYVDDIGQLHGTWGGLAVIPGTDKFEVVVEEGYHTDNTGKKYKKRVAPITLQVYDGLIDLGYDPGGTDKFHGFTLQKRKEKNLQRAKDFLDSMGIPYDVKYKFGWYNMSIYTPNDDKENEAHLRREDRRSYEDRIRESIDKKEDLTPVNENRMSSKDIIGRKIEFEFKSNGDFIFYVDGEESSRGHADSEEEAETMRKGLEKMGFTEIRDEILNELTEDTVEVIHDNAVKVDGGDINMEGDISDDELVQAIATVTETENKSNPVEMGLAGLVNGLIKDEYEAIDGYQSAIVSFESENCGEFTEVFRDIIAEENNHIGQLQEILNRLSPGTTENIDQGQVEAQNQIDG